MLQSLYFLKYSGNPPRTPIHSSRLPKSINCSRLRGVGLVEYGLILTMIITIVLAALLNFGQSTSSSIVSNANILSKTIGSVLPAS